MLTARRDFKKRTKATGVALPNKPPPGSRGSGWAGYCFAPWLRRSSIRLPRLGSSLCFCPALTVFDIGFFASGVFYRDTSLVPPVSRPRSMLDRFCDVTVDAEKLGTDVVAVAIVVFAFSELAVSIEKPACGFSFRIQVVPFDDFSTAIPRTPDDPIM